MSVRRFVVVSLLLLLVGAPASYAQSCGSTSCPQSASLAPFRKLGQPRYAPSLRTPPLNSAHSERAGLRPGARVATQSFRQISPKQGEWSGTVEGQGPVHLTLEILEGGEVTSSRYIGYAPLKVASTSFRFRSYLPTTAGWSWRIALSSRPP